MKPYPMELKLDLKEGYIRPTYNQDIPMFCHCAGGSVAVTSLSWCALEPVFIAHGVIFTGPQIGRIRAWLKIEAKRYSPPLKFSL